MGRLALGTSRDGRGPALWFLGLDSGCAVPVPTALDNGGAFDGGQGRRGWTAVQVEYQTAAFVDGGGGRRPALLPAAWSMLPAAADDLVVLKRYFGGSTQAGELTQLVWVDPEARVHRELTLPWPFDPNAYAISVVGEVESGVVTS